MPTVGDGFGGQRQRSGRDHHPYVQSVGCPVVDGPYSGPGEQQVGRGGERVLDLQHRKPPVGQGFGQRRPA